MIKILVVDDSALIRKLFGQVLSTQTDFEVSFARNGREALDSIKTIKPDVVTLDIHMPEMDGLTCLDRIMIERPCAVVMVSSTASEGAETTLEALRLGAVDFVAKPTGAVSLGINELAPQLIEKVRLAAGVKLKTSLRLRERVRHKIGEGVLGKGIRPKPDTSVRAVKLASADKKLVLIGTSTGGPPALEALLTSLPASFPLPIVVAQHMPATFTGPLARRLDGLCQLHILEVRGPAVVKPGCVYIGQGDADIVISQRGTDLVAMAVPSDSGYPWHPSTDRLVRSAMNYLAPHQLIGVLMTGMGNDGAEAMALMHARGGQTIAEAEETAVVWGMPGELVKSNGADFVVPLHKIADQLKKLVR